MISHTRYLSIAVPLYVRWMTSQIYVYTTAAKAKDYKEYVVNKSGGTTISILKRGGWAQCWSDAKVLAGWEDSDQMG